MNAHTTRRLMTESRTRDRIKRRIVEHKVRQRMLQAQAAGEECQCPRCTLMRTLQAASAMALDVGAPVAEGLMADGQQKH